MRTKKSFFNMCSNFGILLTQTILSFVVRTFFIKILGESDLGLDGLLTNILSMLSVAELGITTAISFILYKPLSDKNNKKIAAIMKFYKKMYQVIGIIVFIGGLCIMPFLGIITKDYSSDHLYLIYMLYLINTVSIYFISYKDVLIAADQNNYKLVIINFISTVAMYLLQLLVLVYYQSFIGYLLIQLIVKLVQRAFINIYITKKYTNIDFNTKDKIETSDLKTIKTNVKSLFFSKIGDYCIFSTDNILISALVNLSTVGIYSNYASIIAISRSLINSLFSGIIASFGDLAVNEEKKVQYNVFKIIKFINYIFYGLLAVIFFIILSKFINLWLGEKYVLGIYVLLVICANFYLMGTQVPFDTIKQAVGFYKKDKYVPIVQAIINIVLSIIFGKLFGLIGILLATSISYIILPCWIRPYLIYKYVFNENSLKYFIDEIKYLIIVFLTYFSSYFIVNCINLSNDFIYIILSSFVTAILFVIFITIVFRKQDEFIYLKDLFLQKIIKNKKK